MTLLLPLLMLGVAVAADQPQPAGDQVSTAAIVKTQAVTTIANRPFASSQSKNSFVGSDQSAKPASSDSQDEARKEGCFTMRSYYFEREDDRGMEFLGMTTCDPARAVTQKHVTSHPRLVPAN
jgi:hypothetical protein